MSFGFQPLAVDQGLFFRFSKDGIFPLNRVQPQFIHRVNNPPTATLEVQFLVEGRGRSLEMVEGDRPLCIQNYFCYLFFRLEARY